MEIREAKQLAQDLMDEFVLYDWTFCWDRSVRRFGQCRRNAKQIGVSKPLTVLNDRATVEDVIRHEIAHALPGGQGHGPSWKRNCAITGARPERCYESSAVITPEAAWRVECVPCGWSAPRHRRSRATQIHIPCRSTVTWSRA